MPEVPESHALLLSAMIELMLCASLPFSSVCHNDGLSWWFRLLYMAHSIDACVLKQNLRFDVTQQKS